MGTFRKILLLCLAACWIGCSPASAEKRVALIIGNSAYQRVPELPNPVNDAMAVSGMLKAAGFDAVDTQLNSSANELRKALRDFGDKSRGADIAVIYYAGHGIELDGVNYLVPVDATLQTDADVLDEAVPLDRVLFAIEPAKQLRLVILDACRDNPFAKSMKRTVASRGIGRGLAKVDPTNPNTLIAFAAKAGSTADDGDKNSPFTAALVEYLPKPGLDVRKAFGFVRDEVLKNTGYRQEPYVYGSLGGDDVSLVPAKPTPADVQATPRSDIRQDFEYALHLDTRGGWSAFLAQYPTGFYSDLAKGELDKIAAEEARVTATEKARLAEQERARLAAEGARRAELAKAIAAAKEAENARLAAEKAKQAEVEKANAAEAARAAAEKEAEETKQQLAALSQAAVNPSRTANADLPRALQAELRRLGCNTGAVDGDWNAASQNALDLFNKYAGTKLDAKTASADALDVLKSKTGRVCPLICDHGFRADGDRCVKITCRSGFRVNDRNECEKAPEKKSIATREQVNPKRDAERNQTDAAPSKQEASGQVFCNQQGCRPVAKGCRLASGSPAPGQPFYNRDTSPGQMLTGRDYEICTERPTNSACC